MKYNTVVLLGPPGAGKTTVGKRLAKELPDYCFYCSTGDIVRSVMTQDSDLGEELRNLTEAGQFTPDKLICEMLINYLQQNKSEKKYFPEQQSILLDGCPRTIPQAEQLNDHLNFVEIYHCGLEDNLAKERILVIRAEELKKAGKSRIDDNPEAVASRLKDYHDLTEPTLDFYRKEKILITEFDMKPSKDDVFKMKKKHFISSTLKNIK